MKIKRVFAFLIILFITITLSACNNVEQKELTCGEIIQAYEEAGYANIFHEENESNEFYIIIYKTENINFDLAEINIYSSTEAAKDAANKKRYNIAIWFISAFLGETRWLESGHYGNIQYSSYDSKLLKPLKELLN